jgi:hypothetical protein
MVGEILSASIPSMMAEAVKFELQREAADKNVELKEREMDENEATGAMKRELIAEQILEAKQKVLSAQREVNSYDDSLLVKITEMQGNVASFFLNSSPETAAGSEILADLKNMMRTVSERADLIVGTQPAIPPINP